MGQNLVRNFIARTIQEKLVATLNLPTHLPTDFCVYPIGLCVCDV